MNWYPTDSDNHADTHCFGNNFHPILWTGMQCTVSPFLESLGTTDKIDICNAATVWTNENDETFILIFGQGLWFGNLMPH